MKNFINTFAIGLRLLRDNPALLFRYGIKQIKLIWYQKTGFWPHLLGTQERVWNEKRIELWLQLFKQGKYLFAPQKNLEIKHWAEKNPEWTSALKCKTFDMLAGKFCVYGQVYQFDLSDFPWNRDWRYGYEWPKKYYKKYNFYEPIKSIPYDVKYPWELSRMGFLIILGQMAVIEENGPWSDFIKFLADDWIENNPIGHSINWEPMTCAIHGISLSLVLQMLAGVPNINPSIFKSLLSQISLQGEFLYRNIEDSIIHHNHYTSDLIGLLVMGFLLRDVYHPAKKWFDYAIPKIDKEILSQFYEDGVNFEKSVSYHRLVTELFLLGIMTAEKAGNSIQDDAKTRIYNACMYTHGYTRVDGLAANFGDNDGAWLLAFDPFILRDHYSLVALAGAYFNDLSIHRSDHLPSSLPIWLTDFNGTAKDAKSDCKTFARFFEHGGMFISRDGKSGLIADFGEVGLNGTGAHGHNDTFSFELSLGGITIIEDAGSPTYTGDIQKLVTYASTAYHNTLMVDGREMATMPRYWRILDEARPYNVVASFGETIDEITGEHAGYTRLPDPVIHQRTLRLFKAEEKFICCDKIMCKGHHRIERFLWLNSEITPEIIGSSLQMTLPNGTRGKINWQSGTQVSLESMQISDVFGSTKSTYRVTLVDDTHGERDLSLEVMLEP